MNLIVVLEKHYCLWYLIFISILFDLGDGQKSLRQFLTQKSTKNTMAISSSGDAMIAGLLPTHYYYNQKDDKCEDVDEQGSHLILAMLYAIAQVNENPQLLPDIRLGYDIRDTCHNKKHSAQEALKLLSRLLPFEEGTYGEYDCNIADVDKPNNGPRIESVPFIGLIGTTTYESTVATANTLDNFGIDQITPSALAVSDNDDQPGNLYSMQPTFRYHLMAIAQLIEYFDMTRIVLIAIEPPETNYRLDILRTLLQDDGRCIAIEYTIAGNQMAKTITEVVQNLKLNNEVQVLVLLGPFEEGILFMQEADKQNLTGKTWIGAGEWVTSPKLYAIRKEVIGGLFAITTQSVDFEQFQNYLLEYVEGDQSNDGIQQLWLQLYDCIPGQGDCAISLGGYEYVTGTNSSCKFYLTEYNKDSFYVIDAIYAMAHALHRTLDCTSEACKPTTTYNYTNYKSHLKSVEFNNLLGQHVEFYQNNGIRHIQIDNLHNINNCLRFIKVATIDLFLGNSEINNNDIRWHNGESTTIPTQVYRTSCSTGYRKLNLDKQSCYYTCLECGPGLVSNGTTPTCIKCSAGFKANAERSNCTAIPPTTLNWRHPINITILSFILAFMLLLLFIFVVYIKYNDTPIVKASNRAMSYLQLFSVAMLFILAASYQFAVTTSLCWFQYAMCAVALPLCNACLLTKTKHVANVFAVSSRVQRVHNRSYGPWFKSLMQVLFVLSITGISVIIWLVFVIIDPPRAAKDYRYEEQVHMHCTTKLHIGLGLIVAYTLVLATISTLLAWKTRKLPDNFNEARYIFICSFSALVIVALTVPGYYSTIGQLQAAFGSIAVVSFGLSILLLLFIPKVYTMIFRPDLNTKAAMLRSIQEFTFNPDTRIATKTT